MFVIPSWNGRELLSSISLPSLREQTNQDFAVVVVDNGSRDGSVEYLRESWPDVRIISLADNIGFAGAVNRGIEATREELVVLLNNDVELECDWLENMLKVARTHPEAGSFACRIRDFQRRELIATVGDCVGASGQVFWRGWREVDVGQYETLMPVFSPCAAAALYRRSAFESVGTFDESFFAYFEDVDWGFRAQLAGYPCMYVPDAIAYHLGGATSSRMTGLQAGLIARNGYLLFLKNYPIRLVMKRFPSLAFVILCRFYRVFRAGHRRHAVRAVVSAARLTPAAVRYRSTVNRTRRLDNSSLEKILAREATLGSDKLARLKALISPLAPPAQRRKGASGDAHR